MDLAILDTDTLSEFFKRKNSVVLQNAANYLQLHQQYAISAITRYQVQRGMLAKKSSAQLLVLDAFCQRSLIFPVDDRVLTHAANLWASARQSGLPCEDSDLIIAATALEHQRVLVTGNTAHFAWIPNLRLANWRNP